MILIVGLGNPGQKYQKTRHNLGRLIVSRWRKIVRFPNFKFQKKFNALISKGNFDKNEIILALPETFMNLSGKSIKLLNSKFKIQNSNLWVIHDDIDLPLGKIRISKGRGAAGHRGVESIIRAINSKNFVRFRIGIMPKNGKPKNAEDFVLQKFNKGERKIIKKVIQKTIGAIEMALKVGLE